MAFAALSLETQALMHERKMCFRRLKGDTSGARAAGAQTVQDLQVVQAQWERALYWLEQLATDEQGEPRSREELAHIRRLFYETTEQLHRLNTLTFQVQEGCVVYYQQMGVVVEEEEQERAGRQTTIGEGEEQE